MKGEKGKSEKEAFERFRHILKKLEGFEIDDIMSYLSMFVELRTGPKSDRNPLALIGGMSERENENFDHPNEEAREWVNEWEKEFRKQVKSEGEEKRAVELSPFFVYLRRLKVFDEWELAEMKPAFVRWLVDKYYNFDLRIEEGDLVVANGDIALGAFSQALDNRGIVGEFVEWFQSTQDELEGFGSELGLNGLGSQREKIKWKAKAAQLGYIFRELVDKGFIEPPTRKGKTNYAALARLIDEYFEHGSTLGNIEKELKEGSLSNDNRENFSFPKALDK